MKSLRLIILHLIFLPTVAFGQNQNYKLTVSSNIDTNNASNKAVIEVLNDFLETKNQSYAFNKNWLQQDFATFVYPYFDLYQIENSKFGANYYLPTLMEILPTVNPNQKILKLAFIGHNKETNENQLRCIYNIVANIENDKIVLSKYTNFATKNWTTIVNNSVTYRISPFKNINQFEINQQQKDIEKLCQFFNCKAFPITYYSCINPKELFEIKGFDYNPMMYVDSSGGFAEFGKTVYSGNNSELYTHEIVHIYTINLFPNIDRFIDEGLASYIAGSGKYNYEWHRNKFRKFLLENPTYNIADYTNVYDRIYFEKETSIPYFTAALIIERTIRLYGKSKLITLLQSNTDLWNSLKLVGITKENINETLRKEINLSISKF